MAGTGRTLWGAAVGGGFAAGVVLALAGAGRAPEPASGAYADRAAAHYAKVERELASADVGALSPDRRAARDGAISALRAYRERRDFGRNTGFPGARVPYFVDDAGRRCAVAEMLHAAGEDALVERVARTANHAWVADLAGDAAFRDWLDRTGLTLAEAARVQVPGSQEMFEPPGANGNVGEGLGNTPEPEGRTPRGGDGRAPTASGDAPVGRAAAGAGRSAAGSAASWALWWEFAKLEFVPAHPLRVVVAASGAARRAEIERQVIDAKRASAARAFAAALDDRDAGVRAAAAVALGRVGGADAVPRLVAALADADVGVRERAILGLGATGTAEAADVLLRLARTGAPAPRAESPSPAARQLAIVALALARRAGLAASFDAEIAALVGDAKKRDLADVGAAAFVHAILAPGAELDAAARAVASDAKAPEPARVFGAQALARPGDAKGAAVVRNLVGDRRVDVRRAAALALGATRHDLAGAQLRTAYELETEPLTRAFTLVSLGRLGGAEQRDFLRAELAGGPQPLRPWAALALGVLARDTADAEAVAALRSADLPEDAQGALGIARGLARDGSALPALVEDLRGAASPLRRAHAATALALLGGDAAHDALVAAATSEESELARVVAAWALGSMGRDADAKTLLAVLDGLRDPGLQGIAAVALGLHGGEAAVDGALRRGADATKSPAARAAAIEAAGLLLSRGPGLSLRDVSRNADYAALPGWLRRVLSVTL